MLTEKEAMEMLQRAVLGELSFDDPRLIAACREHPRVGAELSAVRSAQRLLDATAELEREILAEVRHGGPVPASVLRDLQRRARPSFWRRGRVWMLLAAAVFCAAILWWALQDGPRRTPQDVLAPNVAVRCEKVDGGYRLGWDSVPRGGGYFTVRVFDGATGEELLLVAEPLFRAEFSLPQAARWATGNRQLRVVITEHLAGGDPRAVHEGLVRIPD